MLHFISSYFYCHLFMWYVTSNRSRGRLFNFNPSANGFQNYTSLYNECLMRELIISFAFFPVLISSEEGETEGSLNCPFCWLTVNLVFIYWWLILKLERQRICLVKNLSTENGLKTLSQFGITTDSILKCDDFLQDYSLEVKIFHA